MCDDPGMERIPKEIVAKLDGIVRDVERQLRDIEQDRRQPNSQRIDDLVRAMTGLAAVLRVLLQAD